MRVIVTALFTALCSAFFPGLFSLLFVTQVSAEQRSLEDIYLHLHAHPELSRHEQATAALMAEELRAAGFEVTENFGGFGVVGVLKNGSGPTVLIRTDMDALPVTEETGAPYASEASAVGEDGSSTPVMHACGHDVHMSVFIGVARLLTESKATWAGTALLVAQPAEEVTVGARSMLEAGLFEKFGRPDYALMLHNDAELQAGKVGWISGPAMAGVDFFDIVIHGVGGHGGYPQKAKDPIVVTAQFVTQVQSLVSREIDPTSGGVVTIGTINGGSKANVIPDFVRLSGTTRFFSPEVRAKLRDGIWRHARAAAIGADLEGDLAPEVAFRESEWAPPLVNNPELVAKVRQAWSSVLAPADIVERKPVMGAEDFAFFGATDPPVPIMMFRLGAVSPERWATRQQSPLPSLHSGKFLPDYKRAIPTGVQAMGEAAMALFAKQ